MSPIYQYRCQKCSHIFEEFFKNICDENISQCPQCLIKNETGIGIRIISQSSFVLKGEIWASKSGLNN